MQKTFLNGIGSLFLFLLFMLNSCINNDTETSKKDTPEESATKETGGTIEPALLSGNMDTLYYDAAAFKNLGNGTRLTLRFYIASATALTLHGWTGNPNSWNNKPPEVKLSVGRPSSKPPVSYGTGSYFGNLELSPNQFNNIVQKINSKNPAYKFVVFGPINPVAGADAGQISYAIYVTDDDPSFANVNYIYKFAVVPTDEITNPSPPRNSQ